MTRRREAARRLARALADALPGDGLERAASELGALAQAISAHDRLGAVLAHPAVPARRRGRLGREVARLLGLSEPMQRLAEVLGREGAFALLPAAHGELEQIVNERKGVVRATVTAARPLDDRQRQQLREALARVSGREVTLDESIDPALIGGVVARIGSILYDGSLKSRLDGLRGRIP